MKLHRLKQLKSQIALGKVIRLKSEFAQAQTMEDRAEEDLQMIVANADQTRTTRLRVLFQAETDHGSLHYCAVGEWLKTEREMDQARFDLGEAQNHREDVSNRLKLAQQELAHKMRGESKAEKLCFLEAEKVKQDQLRHS